MSRPLRPTSSVKTYTAGVSRLLAGLLARIDGWVWRNLRGITRAFRQWLEQRAARRGVPAATPDNFQFESMEPRVLLSADLSMGISGFTPASATPGAAASATVQLLKQGADALGDAVRVKIFASPDATLDSSDRLIGQIVVPASQFTDNVPLTVSVPLDTGAAGQPGAFRLIGVVDPDDTIAESNEANNRALAADTLQLSNSFGKVGAATIPSLTLTDGDGTRFTLTLNGNGTAVLGQDASGYLLQLSGTDASTQLVLSASGGDGRITFGGITVAGAIGSISAAAAELRGTLAVAGSMRTLVLGDARGAQISSTGTSLLTVTGGVFDGVKLLTTQVIDTLKVSAWNMPTAGSSLLQAGGITSVQAAQGFTTDMLLSGVGAGALVLGTFKAGGAVGASQWNINGRAGNIEFASSAAGWRANIKGQLSLLGASGDVSGLLAVSSLQMLQIGGMSKNFTLLVGADLGSDAALGGSGSAADKFSAGTLARVRVTGAMSNTLIMVGVNPVDGVFHDGNDIMLSTSLNKVQELYIGGALDASSRIVAPAFPAAISVDGRSVAPASLAQLSTDVRDQVAPLLAARLNSDTGTSNSDGLTWSAEIAGTASDAKGATVLLAALDPAAGVLPGTDVSASLQANGNFALSAAQLAVLAGGTLTDGAHTVRLMAADAAGNRSAPVDVSFVLDRSAPVAIAFDLDAASDTGTVGDRSTTAAVVTLAGRSEPAALVRLLGLDTTTQADANGFFSFAGVGLTMGANSFTIVLSDGAGNASQRSLALTRIAPDTTAPALAAALVHDTGASASDRLTSDPAIQGSASDNVQATALRASLDPAGAAAPTVDFSTSLQADGSFAISAAQLAALADGALADGAHTLRLVAADAAGNASAPLDVSFVLDTTAPATIAFDLAPASDTGTVGDNITTAAVATLAGRSAPATQVRLLGLDLTTQADADGFFSFAGLGLTLGANPFTIELTDAAGNSSQRLLTVTRNAPSDTTAPTLAAALATDTGASATDGITRDPAIAGTASDNVKATVLRAVLDPVGAAVPNVDFSTSLQADGSFTISAAQLAALAGGTLADGAHTLRLVAADAAGNSSAQAEVHFVLDTTAPLASAFDLAPASDTGTAGDQSTTAAVVTLAGRSAPATTVSLPSAGLVTQTDADGYFSFAGINLGLGANTFTIGLADIAGNSSQRALTITRTALATDTAAPSVAAALANDTGASATDHITRDPVIAGSATDNVKATRLLAALDPAAGALPTVDLSAALQADGSFTLSAAQLAALAGGTLADGAHTLRLRAADAAGNASAAIDVGFMLDTGAPALASFGFAAADASDASGAQTAAARAQLKGQAEEGAVIALASQGLSTVAGAGGLFVLPDVDLQMGANLLSLTATDAAGNVSTLQRTLTRVAQTQGDAVLLWNEIALRAIQLDVTDPPVATRNLAILSIAQYDTLAAIEGTPAFLYQFSAPGPVDAQLAVAVAAHRILSQTYPAQRAVFDAALVQARALVPDGALEDNSIALGLSVADAIRAARQHDGADGFVDYPGSSVIGLWRPTGPMFDVPDEPQWLQVTPFALASASQLRPAAPPALDSSAYAAAVQEIKLIGSATSATRTADQTQQALFWADGKGSTTPPGHWNQIAAQVAQAQGNSLSANARLFAELNVALADAAIACWDAKYTFGLWRPETAIQNADVDNNAATTVDAAWRPLLITPPHPEYVSGHSTFSGAAAGILAAVFGDATAFSTTSATLPGVTRSFSSFSQAAAEAGRSRVYGGIHYEFTNQAGQVLGQQVADAVLARFALSADTQGPTVVIDTAPLAAKTNLTFSGQVFDNLAGVDTAQYRIDAGPLQALALGPNGSFSITTALATDGSADGSHVLTVLARDKAGNLNPGVTASFVLDTAVPTVSLTSLAEGAVLGAAARLSGVADANGTALTQLSYRFDGGASNPLVFDPASGAFDTALNFGALDTGSHVLTLTARDAAGNLGTLTRHVTVDALAPLTITGINPVDGTQDVGVTQHPRIDFSRAVNPATLTALSLYATGPGGATLPATIVPSADGSFAWLFFDSAMPGGAQITLHVDGSRIRAATDGAFLDADNNGSAGGVASYSFTTVSQTPVIGTKLVGRVVDPGPDLEPMTFDDIRRGPDGVIHTPDDVFVLPIAHAKVYILGQEDKFVYTDANGYFELTNTPAGIVKVAVDGRTASNAPSGVFFPEMVMEAELQAGLTNTVMDSMGTSQERLANTGRQEVYLPRIATSILRPVSDSVPTVITALDPKAAPALSEEQRASLTLTINPGSAVDAHGQPVANAQIGIATVPPELVRDMLPPGILQHTFDITIQAPGVAAFTEPVQITFPNVFNAAPGTKLSILSFDHTTGKLVINGTGTVSADGLTVVSDPDSGVRAPGWHGMAPPGPRARSDKPRRSGPTTTSPPGPPINPWGPPPPPPPVIVIPPPVVVIPLPIAIPPIPIPPAEGQPIPPVSPPPVVVVPGLPDTPVYGIDIRMPAGAFTPIQQDVIRDAVARWSQIVVGDLPADLTVEGLVDDLLIKFNVGTIDGAGHTLARTELLDVRTGSLKLPSLASITLDAADLATLSPERLHAVLMHEIAHAMGFGELWSSLGLVDNSVAGNPRFNGANAAAAYTALTGVPQTRVPLDNRSGANATHWREALFGNELMTPLLDANGPYPVSALTAGALKDMGYTVDMGAVDGYSLPGASFVFHPNATAAANSGDGELLDATGGGVTPAQVAAAPAPTPADHLFFAFDFGPAGSPVAPGFAGVSASTTFTAARGWGWNSGPGQVSDAHTGTSALAPLTADFAQTSNATFSVALPNGTYDVIVTLGDDAAAHSQMSYTIEGARRGAVSTTLGQHASLVHRVEVLDGQMDLNFSGASVALNALEIHQVSSYVTPASNLDYTSGTFFLAIQNLETGFILRNQVEVTSGAPLCIDGVTLAPNTAYRQYVYHVDTNTVAVSEFVTPASGVTFDMPELLMGSRVSGDDDGDGLENLAEFVIGTRADRADTDHDGIGDRAELLQRLDPLGGLNLPNGVIATQQMQGTALALEVAADPGDPASLTAFVATGSRGLAIVDVSRYSTPIVLADLDLSGNAQDVAVDMQRQRALVAAGDGGLHLVDISDRAAPRVIATIAFDGSVTQVEVRDGLAYVGYAGSLAVLDVNTGEVRQTLNTGSGSIQSLAVDGDRLYTLNDGFLLRAFTITGGVLASAGLLNLPTSGRSLFVADGVAWIGAETGFPAGFMTASVANPASLALISGVDNLSIAGRALALNGSGLGVGVGGGGGGGGVKVLDVFRTTDPANTGNFVARYDLPEMSNDVRIAGGMAYVAAGNSGLVVVNYAGFDNLGVAPTVSITADAVDVDPATPGIQVLAGRSVRVRPVVADDVQIRSLELLVGGAVVASDSSFPYELFAQAPLLPAGSSTGSMAVQVRATDTGGNTTLSNLITLSVVPDTFAPVLGSINLDEGARRFFVRSIDLTFDEPLDLARIAAGGITLLRDGGDGIPANGDDVPVALHFDTRSQGQTLSIVLDGILPTGSYRLRIDPSAIADRAGNVLAAPIVRNFSIRPASDVHALSGIADIPTAPSANPGQQIGIAVPFDPATARADVKVIDAAGNVTTRVISVFRADAAHGIAWFIVPLDATTGDAVVYSQVGSVRTDFADGTFPLQIVPTITDVQVQSVAADGSSAVLRVEGTGLVEGGNSEYRFGTAIVTDPFANTGPDVGGRSDAVLGFIPNGFVNVTVPISAGVFGPISLKTAGGASASYSVSIASVGAVALSGTPADATIASANAGQAITLNGAGLSTSTDLLMRYVNINGVTQMERVSPVSATADGTRATLLVPEYANGAFSLQVFGSSDQPVLQIVPVVRSFDVQDRTVLYGSGFVEGASTYNFAGASVTDTAADPSTNVDVYYNATFSFQNGGVFLNRTALPRHGLGNASVTTAGGTSAPLALNALRTVGIPGDVAINPANGDIWISDQSNPGQLQRIDRTSGAVLQTVTMTSDFGTPYTFNYAGLQFVTSPMTLGSTTVPAGSLLVFNGYVANDRVVAVNPTTGAVIASLTLAANYDLTAGAYHAASGHLFVTEQNGAGNRLIELNPATGAQVATYTLPISVQSWAGLAVDSAGHLWVGSYNGGSQVIEFRVDGPGVLTELRRIDTRSQNLNQNEISGLSFAPDGALWASSSQGELYRIDTALDGAAVATATLSQIIGQAGDGVAANPGQAAANVNQVIELVGTNFGAGTRVLFNTLDNAGTRRVVSVTPLVIDAGGTRLQVQVPDLATSGDVRVVNQGSANLGFIGSYPDAVYRNVTVNFTAGAATAAIRFSDGGLEGVGNESWGIDNVAVRQGATTVFSDNFESGSAAANWSDASVNSDELGVFSRFGGRFSDSASQVLSLSGLTAGQNYTLSFDLLVLDSWDGGNVSAGPDLIDVSVDGVSKLRETLSNSTDSASAQTFRASPGIRLQVVPTLASLINGARPGEDQVFYLSGSGFMEGASTITVGGIAQADGAINDSPFDVTGRNDTVSAVAPRALDGPIRITTDGGYAEVASANFGGQPTSVFTGIVASSDLGTPANPGAPSAITGQSIVLQGQGFTSSTLVQFQGIDDQGVLGTLTRTGSAGANGTTLTVVVPALARSGAVTVLGSGTSIALQVAPTLRAIGGIIAAGNTIVLEGSGLTANDLAIAIDGRPVGSFSVRTVVDGTGNNRDQQFVTVLVPNGVGAGVVTATTAGGTARVRTGLSLTDQGTAAAGDGDTMASAVASGLASDARIVLTGAIGTGGATSNDVDMVRVDLVNSATMSITVSSSDLNSRVRVFNAAGVQLDAANFSIGATNVFNFTAPVAGTYYIGISGSGNNSYNPAVAGSGVAADAGSYSLRVETQRAGSGRLVASSANAASGTAARSGVASANTGQSVVFSGVGLVAGDRLVFTSQDDFGNVFDTAVTSVVDVGAQTISATVPLNATTGRVRLERDRAGVLLQVVPTLSDVTINGSGFAGAQLTLSGTGFTDAASSVLIGAQRIDDVSRSSGADVFSQGTRLNLTVPAGAATGPIRVSTVGGTSAAFGIGFTGLVASAASGAPAGAAASANPGQTITLQGNGLDSSTDIVFQVIDAAGNVADYLVRPTIVNAAGTEVQVRVPIDATTGLVKVVGSAASFTLQVLPVITDVQVQSVASDGSSAVVLISGTGFQEGGNSEYRFGSRLVLDAGATTGPDVSARSDSVLGYIPNGYVRVTVPLSAGVFGAITIKTAGGTSAAYSVNLASVATVALSGTPADAAKGSANAGQAITLNGSGLSTSTDIMLRYVNINGTLQMVQLSPSTATADGTSATLIVPGYANGAFSLQVFGSASQPLLQIVPTVTSVDVQDRTQLFGSGFVEGATSYSFAGASVTDIADDPSASIDVYYNADFSNQNGSVYLNRTALPRHGLGNVSVTTAGGTSAPLALNTVRTAGIPGDVAINPANGDIWISDQSNPGQLQRINPATGAVLQTVTMTSDFGTPYTFNYAGLQFVTSPMTLGSTTVPAGSLLVFNGYVSNDRVVAVNPVTGAVIASLTLAANYDLTAGAYHAASGHLFVTEQNGAGNRLIELNPATGAQVATYTLPISVQSWAGLAVDSAGHLWVGSYSGGSQVIEFRVDGPGVLTELRRIDTRSQNLNQNEISGLSFAPNGALWASSSQGELYRIDTALDGAAVATATLSQIIGQAANGVAANPGQAAANVDQVIELVGSNFGAGTRVLFNTVDSAGNRRLFSATPLAIDAGGTRLQVQVPPLATSGDVRVVNQGAANLGFNSYADAVYRNVTVNFTAGAATSSIRFSASGLEGVSNESWGIDNVAVRDSAANTVFSDSFESGAAAANWSDASVNSDGVATFSRFSGRFSDSASQVLSLSGLTAGQNYTLSFDLLVLDSWDGSNTSAGPDLIDVSVDGVNKLHESFANSVDPSSVQTFRASPGIRLQVVPTLASLINGARPGEDQPFYLTGSGFTEGASTVTVGGVALADAATNNSPLDVSGARNDTMSAVAPRTLDGPIRITTEGGYAELPANFGSQPLSTFTGIIASSDAGAPANPAAPSAITGQSIVLQGQGFTSSTLVQFQGIDDQGVLGTVTRTGSPGTGGTTLSVVVPAIARSGAVTVLGSGSSIALQVVPTLRAIGGTVAAGNTIVLEGSGLTRNDLAIAIDGQAVTSYTVRTVVDGTSTNRDQQLVTVLVPAGVGAGVVTATTAGGLGRVRTGLVLADQGTAAAGDADTMATAVASGLGSDSRIVLTGVIGDGVAGSSSDVDVVRVDLVNSATLSIAVSSSDLNSRVRVFDANGVQLASAFFGSGATNVFDFTAPAGGTYFLGISGNGNNSYNPALAGSGVAADAGSYSLRLEAQRAGSSRLVGSSASAASGTPARSGIASANTGQTVVFSGVGLVAGDRLAFTVLDDSGNLFDTVIFSTVDVGAQTISAVVPVNATTGRVRLERDRAGVLLQVVPTLSDLTMNGSAFGGAQMQLSGTGFAEGASAVLIGANRFDDMGRYYDQDVFSQGTRLNFFVPSGAATGPFRVSTVGGTSAAFGIGFTGLAGTAASGTAANPAQASANPGQAITVQGSGLDTGTDVIFKQIDANGNVYDYVTRPASVNAGGTAAQVVVPLDAISGEVRVVGSAATFYLQVLPTIADVQVQSVAADGSSAALLISGTGFQEGANSEYRFGSRTVLDAGATTGPDVLGRNDPVLGYVPNGYVTVTVPLSAGAFGAITIKTAGGTSAAYSVNLGSISATAASGTPASAAAASANAGQSITLNGSGLSTSTDVLLRYVGMSGSTQMVKLSPASAAANGSSATLVLPDNVNGAFALQVFGSASQPLLQIVPTVTSVDVQDRTQVFGSGFVEGATSYSFAGASVADIADDPSNNIDVYYNAAFTSENGSVFLNRTALPRHGLGNVSVTTAGGTSAPLALNTVRTVGIPGDVAINPANGDIWISDQSNPGQLQRIDPATGAVLQTVTMTSDFGTFTFNYAGLQFVTSPMTLGSTTVPAGSLLVFNGYVSNDRVVAVNPVTGAVIASLTLGGNYDLTAGAYHAASGHLFITESNGTGTRLLELNPATGALVASSTLTINAQSWAGLAIDSAGHLWVGSYNGGAQVIEYRIDGPGALTELRRVDTRSQNLNQNEISGLSFAPDGALWISSTLGELYRLIVV